MLGYSRQAFYKQVSRSNKQLLEESIVLETVKQVRAELPKTGTVKLMHHCNQTWLSNGIKMGRDKTYKLLRDNKLLLRNRKRNTPQTTWSNHWLKKYPDLVKEGVFTQPNQLWVADITYLPVREGKWCYIFLITDAVTKMIMGYHVSAGLDATAADFALKMALGNTKNTENLIHHSDRGIQYCSQKYTTQLQRNHIKISMTQSGNPRDNAIAERINGILKNELIYPFGTIENLSHARITVKTAVEKYNNKRLHQHLNYKTPSQYLQQLTTY